MSPRHRADVILVNRVRLAGVPLLLFLGLSLPAPAVAGLSEAAAEPIVKPALLMGDGRIPSRLAGLRCLQLRGEQLRNGRKLLLSLHPTGREDECEGGEGYAHRGDFAILVLLSGT